MFTGRVKLEVIGLTDEKAKVLRAIAESYVAWRKRCDTPTVPTVEDCALCVYSGYDNSHDCSICPVYIYLGGSCCTDYDYNDYCNQKSYSSGVLRMKSDPIAVSRAKLYAEKIANKLLKLLVMVLEDDRRWR